jgi:hypothetical protein
MSIFHQRIFPSPIVGINKNKADGRTWDDMPVIAGVEEVKG